MSDASTDLDREIETLRKENASLKARYESLQFVYHDNGQTYRDEIGILRENARYMIEKLTDVLGATGHTPGQPRSSVNNTGAVERAVLNCPHEETEDTLVLRYDPGKPGATVGSQLCGRISKALGMQHTSDPARDEPPSADAWLACNPAGVDRNDIVDLLRDISHRSPIDHPDLMSVRSKAGKLAKALAVMPPVHTDEETGRAASRLLQELSAVLTRDVSQHDRDVRTLIEATWNRGTARDAKTVPEWIVELVENCVLSSNFADYAGLADHAAFEAGQDNAVGCVARMLKTATKEKSDV
jgi:hypothetical protein